MKLPFEDGLFKDDLLVGFLAQVVQVPYENRVFGLLYFEGDELLIWTVLYLLNFLNHID